MLTRRDIKLIMLRMELKKLQKELKRAHGSWRKQVLNDEIRTLCIEIARLAGGF